MDTAETASARRTAARGIAALHRLSADLSLSTEAPQVLSNRGSLLLRLPRTGLVARVSTHTGWQRRHPDEWLRTEIAVGRLARSAGVPAALPAQGVDPGPHEVDGLWISLWEDLGDDVSRASTEQVAETLAAWHRALADCGSDLQVLPMIHEGITEPLEYAVRHGTLDRVTFGALTREHEEALSAVDTTAGGHVLLHGDSHRGNLHRDQSGTWRLIDLEEACRGPVVWDLAVLAGADEGSAALSAYCRITGVDWPTPAELAPWSRLRRLQGLAWMLGCAVTFPERYAAPAAAAVADLLAEA